MLTTKLTSISSSIHHSSYQFSKFGRDHYGSTTSLLANIVIVVIILSIMFVSLEGDDDDEKNDGVTDGLPPGWPPENVDATSSIGPDNEVTVAVNPTDPDNLVAGSKDYALGPNGNGGYIVWAGYFYSKDGGRTWGDGLVGREAGSVLLEYDQSSDPVIAYGPDGTVYYCGLAYGTGLFGVGRNALWIAESTDGGETWNDPYIVMAWESQGLFHDKQWLIVDQDNGNMYLTWTPFFPDGSRIFFGRSTDGGNNWDYYPISDWVAMGDSVQGSSLAVGTDGVLNVIWIDYDTRKLTLAQNTADGSPEGWTNPRVIADVDWVFGSPNAEYRVPTMPALASDPSTGIDDATLYAVWHDNSEGNTDIVIIRSGDGGASWSEPVIVNDDGDHYNDDDDNDDENDTGGHHQFFPWVTVSPEGEVGVVFYDRRDDPEDTLLHTYLAWSPDGINWTKNLQVTTNATNGSYGYHQSGNIFMGDYIGLAISDEAVHPVWADCRLGWGQSHLFSARIPLEDLRTLETV